MPGRLDEQSPHMGVAGLGDRPLHPGGARGELAGHQADIGADSEEPVEPCPCYPPPRSTPARSTPAYAAQATQPIDRVGEAPRPATSSDPLIQAIPAAVAASTASKLWSKAAFR